MAEKSCRGGFLESLCQWVALQNQQYGGSSNARAWGWNSSTDTAPTELHIARGLVMGSVGTLQPGWWEQGGCWGGEEQAQGQARRHHRGVRGAAVVWGQPSQQECKSIHVHMGQSQFMSVWITSSRVGAAPQPPLLSYCNVLSAAKSHLTGHPKT